MRVGHVGHRVHETDFIRHRTDVRQQIRNHFSTLPTWSEFPTRLCHVAIIANQLGFVVKRVNLTNRTGAKNDDYIFGLTLEMRVTRFAVGILFRKQACQRYGGLFTNSFSPAMVVFKPWSLLKRRMSRIAATDQVGG